MEPVLTCTRAELVAAFDSWNRDAAADPDEYGGEPCPEVQADELIRRIEASQQ